MQFHGRGATIVSVSLCIAACTTPAGVIPPDAYDPATDARIRVYSVPGHYIWLFPNQTCAQITRPAYHGVKFLGVSMGMDLLLRTVHIGIPQPGNEYDEKYNEFVIKAGQPLTLMAKYIEVVIADPLMPYVINGGESCGPRFATLVPQPGHDYEVFSDTYWPARGMNDCKLHLRTLIKTGDQFQAVPAKQADGVLPCDPAKK